jgi:hypothetical protein
MTQGQGRDWDQMEGEAELWILPLLYWEAVCWCPWGKNQSSVKNREVKTGGRDWDSTEGSGGEVDGYEDEEWDNKGQQP